MGVVFQSYSLFPHMTVEQNVAFPLSVRKTSAAVARGQRRRCARQGAAARVRASASRQQLSGGQQQRVALARALVFEPRVVLMDEPLSALDKKLREEMQLEIRRLHRELGVTMVFVTHDQAEARTLSDRVALFNNGRIEQIAHAEVALRHAVQLVRRRLHRRQQHAARRTRCRARLPAHVARRAAARAIGRESRPMARMQSCAFALRRCMSRAEGAGLATENRLDATLVDAIHQGDHWRLVMQLHDGDAADGRAPEWFAKIGPALPAGLDRGRRVSLGFRADDAWMY